MHDRQEKRKIVSMSNPHENFFMAHLTQEELNDIIRLHAIYLSGKNGGARAQVKFKNLSGLTLSRQDMSHADFTGSCFIGADLSGGNFTSATFFACDMRRSNLENACFIRCDFRGAFVAGANLNGADMKSADLREGRIMEKDAEGVLKDRVRRDQSDDAGVARTVFAGAKMVATNMAAVRAMNADFSDADLSNVVIQGADLRDANMEGANLSNSDLSGSDVRGANFKNSIMADTNMDGVEKANANMEGVVTEKPAGLEIEEMEVPLPERLKAHALWLSSNGAEGDRLDLSNYDMREFEEIRSYTLTAMKAVGANFLNLDFSKVDIQSAVFDEADFRDCKFVESDLRGASFKEARLSRCDLTNANLLPLMFKNADGTSRVMPVNMNGVALRYSVLKNAKLAGIRLKGADLSFADFTGADLRKADLTGAKTNGAIFAGANMEGALMDDGVEIL